MILATILLENDYHYDLELDSYLYKKVGYETLWNMVAGLFPSPYSTTSLREYFARAFEEYFLGNVDYLRRVCPYVYKKLSLLNNEDYLETY